jgi:DNA polymerase III subunit delta'
MSEEALDPRETALHPRFAKTVIGHEVQRQRFMKALAAGKTHHAWLMSGPQGIGKATVAYNLAKTILSGGVDELTKSAHWIEARAHPDLFVLERQMTDRKPYRLKTEIAVDDARKLSDFFGQTASRGGWRVAIVDCVDDLNSESSNALLKLVEEPPSKCVLLLVCHQPGRALRTLKSRCTSLVMHPLTTVQTAEVLNRLDLEVMPAAGTFDAAILNANGSPGLALALLTSTGARVFESFQKAQRLSPESKAALLGQFGAKGPDGAELAIFGELLLSWVASQAILRAHGGLAAAHPEIAEGLRVVEAYNLDRRQAVLEALTSVEDALKTA